MEIDFAIRHLQLYGESSVGTEDILCGD